MVLFAIGIAVTTSVGAYDDQSSQILNIPVENYFNDRSALNDDSTLASKQYQDFIHTLYRKDKDNLMRADNLFSNVGYLQQPANQEQPNYASYYPQQQLNHVETRRRKRNAIRTKFTYDLVERH